MSDNIRKYSHKNPNLFELRLTSCLDGYSNTKGNPGLPDLAAHQAAETGEHYPPS